MFYIFNKNNKCIGKCSNTPDKEDLSSREEFFKESDENFNIHNLSYIDGKFLEKEEPLVDNTPIVEYTWVKEQLSKTDVELMYHWTGDTERQSYTEQDWKDYAIALRNYTTLVDNIPVVNSDVRPTSPYSA
jgi:hypothetical protein